MHLVGQSAVNQGRRDKRQKKASLGYRARWCVGAHALSERA